MALGVQSISINAILEASCKGNTDAIS